MRKNKPLKITILSNVIRRGNPDTPKCSFKINKASAEVLIADGSIKQRHCP